MDESTTGPVNPEGPPEDGPAAAGPAADEPTAAQPAAEEPTAAGPAAMTPAAEGAVSPPLGSPVPTIATGGGGTKMSGKTILIGIVAIAIIAVAVWFFAFRGSGVGDKFVGTWVPVDASVGGGGLVIAKSGDVFTVKLINETGVTTTTLTGKLKGDTLQLALPADLTAITGNMTITATYVKETDHLIIKVVGGGSNQTTELKRAASIPITNPSSMPSATPLSSSTPDAQINLEIRTSTDMVASALNTYAADNSGTYPPMADQATLGNYVNPWPTNPVTGAPIADSLSVGDFSYTIMANNIGYVLAGHLSDGTDYLVNGGSASSASPSPVN